ncbi:hypothetical protein ACQJBY_033945 [Aegilops geniculata]
MAASGAALCLSVVLLLVAVCCRSDVDFMYQGFQHAPNLSLDGSASVLRGGALQLTNGSERLVGHAFYGSPVALGTLDNQGDLAVTSFSTAFVFDIVTVGTGGGHGLAFVVAVSRALPGASPEMYLGVLGPTINGKTSNHVFAVEFDTVTDLEMKETNGNHVGVDVNSLVSNVSEQAAYYTTENKKVPVELESAQQIQAWIDYDGGTSLLNVTVAPVSVAERPRRPLISTKLDLRSVFKENMYVGFSSATGKLASSHYILAWSFRTNGPAQPIDLRRLPKVPRQRTPAPKVLIIKFAAVACAGTLALVAAAMVTALWLRRRAALADKLEEWELEHPQRIQYIELYKATKGFKESGLLGSGGFGHVYKGVLGRRRSGSGSGSGEEVAIKRISSGTKQGMREFVAEISSLGRMRHRNLVELRGWCKHGDDLLLVYEFMPNGSLDAHLFGGGNKVLTWAQRLSVIRGVARGLLYLHEEWEHVVVHRDVKANNVLLGADMGARLGDFGLARLYEHGAAQGTTRVAGTLGYMAPELTVTSRAATATDVFSFGVLLLEVACGRRPVEPGEAADVILVRWVRDCGLDGDLLRAVDPRLDGCYDAAEARLVLWLGMVCSQGRPEARPSMRQVCQFLDGEEVLPEEAVLVFSDPDSSVFPGSSVLSSMTWSSSCGTMSVGSLHGGR